jgi:hypothetical protein
MVPLLYTFVTGHGPERGVDSFPRIPGFIWIANSQDPRVKLEVKCSSMTDDQFITQLLTRTRMIFDCKWYYWRNAMGPKKSRYLLKAKGVYVFNI